MAAEITLKESDNLSSPSHGIKWLKASRVAGAEACRHRACNYTGEQSAE